jgi:hypothetical protein
MKEQAGQGCEGEILHDDELRDVVEGMVHIEVLPGMTASNNDPRAQWRAYDPDGIMRTPGQFRDISGNFWIEGTLLCINSPEETGDVDWCFRLIKAPDGRIMEERLIGEPPDFGLEGDLELSCLELDVRAQEASE